MIARVDQIRKTVLINETARLRQLGIGQKFERIRVEEDVVDGTPEHCACRVSHLDSGRLLARLGHCVGVLEAELGRIVHNALVEVLERLAVEVAAH